MPRVSVLLPVRDAAPWLASSLASLARQTVTDHEVIAIDDGSRDGSGEILEQAAARDRRLVVRHTPAQGLPAALQTALALARAPWVARHDADDLSHRTRFERQLGWLAEHPEVDVLGTGVRLFPRAATGAGMRRWEAWHNALLSHADMHRELLIDSPLAHGTAMIRRSTLESVGGWREHGWAEDLDLWVRLFEAEAAFGKLAVPLYGWRQHQMSSTRTDERYSQERFMSLKVAALDRDFLAGGRTATLLGVGESLERWRNRLGSRVKAVRTLREAGLAEAAPLAPPVLVALMAASARERWRGVLTARGLLERRDFIFVA